MKPHYHKYLYLGVGILFAWTSLAEVTPGQQAESHFKREFTKPVEGQYLIFLPEGYSPTCSEKWPTILFLHGAGERGDDLQKVTVHGPPKIVKSKPDFPFIVISPQCPTGQRWQDDTLLALLEEVQSKYRVDETRIYLTGLSMGGFGSWSLGINHPEKFAAMAPICGGGDTLTLWLGSGAKKEALNTLGLWVFHGAKDTVVPLQRSQEMVDAFKRATGRQDIPFTIYPEAGHDSWTETYNNPKLYEWFLKHSR